MNYIYFCLRGSDSDHFAMSLMIEEQFPGKVCYYRELSDSHIAMWRECKIKVDNVSLAKKFLTDNFEIFPHPIKRKDFDPSKKYTFSWGGTKIIEVIK